MVIVCQQRKNVDRKQKSHVDQYIRLLICKRPEQVLIMVTALSRLAVYLFKMARSLIALKQKLIRE